MPIPLFNSILSWFLKKRIHQIELFLKYPNEVQNEVLIKLLGAGKNTEIGRKYGFESINNYETFKERVPLCQYEDIVPLIERARKGEQNIFWNTPIKWFAKSSGTTDAQSKYIPVSTESLDDCHFKAGKDMLSLYINNNENSQLFSGKGLRLGGSKKLYESNNTYFGDLSAIIIDNLPLWAELVSTPSNDVSLMSDWEVKMNMIVNETIQEDVTSLAGVPSWMMVLLTTVLEKTGKSHVLEVWKNLEVYFHGGVSFEPYREAYEKLMPKSEFNYYEIYNASEGFFGIQDQNHSNELLLMLDYGIFYEFIPMKTFGTSRQNAVRLSDVELHTQYAVVISTNAGLWRYLIGDTIRFTSLHPYRFKVSGRTKHHINVFGEELMIENTDRGLAEISKRHGVSIVDYTVGPIFMKDKNKGGHEWIIEFKTPPKDAPLFAKQLDEELQKLNSDYQAKRDMNITLNPLIIHQARPSLFYDWLKKEKKLGGQHKIPRLSNERKFVEELLAMNQS